MRSTLLTALLLVSCAAQALADNIRGVCLSNNGQVSTVGRCIVSQPGQYAGGDTIYFQSFEAGLFQENPSLPNEMQLGEQSVAWFNMVRAGNYVWDNYHDWLEIGAPVSPPATYVRVYAKPGAGMCSKDSSGTERCMGGAGGGGNAVEVSLALTSLGAFFSTTVTGQAWVTASSKIVCAPLSDAADALTAESIAVADPQAIVARRVAGTGFDLLVTSPNGLEGTVRFSCIGV